MTESHDTQVRTLERAAAQGDPQAEAALVAVAARSAGKPRKPAAPRRVYLLRFECGTEEQLGRTTLRMARRRAREAAREGWDASESTMWVDVTIADAQGEPVETITEAVHPREPACALASTVQRGDFGDPVRRVRGEHDWQDDGAEGFGAVVSGHGGGVILRHRCACGITRTTDTWASRPDTGEQGLESISYSRAGDE